ncbi:hypothetical protein GCM10027589_28480 [Actinocorallia lasiicapitis]
MIGTTARPSRVLLRCQWTWVRLGAPAADVQEMSVELHSDLALAELDGRSALDYVGGDPAGFARAWAAARGCLPQRRYLGRLVAATLAGALPGSFTALFFLFGLDSPTLAQVVGPADPDYCVPGCVPEENLLQLPTPVRVTLVLLGLLAVWGGALAAASAVLRFHGDAARRATVLTLAPALPVAVVAGAAASHEYGRAHDYAYGWSTVVPEILLPFLALIVTVCAVRLIVISRRS